MYWFDYVSGQPTPSEHEYTGAVPVTFNADGTPLLDFLISGNMTQSGTPSPTTPIQPQECGERTGNLLDYTTVESTTFATATQISGGISVSGQYYVKFTSVKFTVGNAYTMSWKSNTTSGTSSCSWRFKYSDNTYSLSPANGGALVVEKEVSELLLYVSTSQRCAVEFTEIMLNSGSTALPYEPYGYKIPISSANTTTPVYLGEVETTRRIRKLVLTGEESWNTYRSTYYITVSDYYRMYDIGSHLSVCSHYPGIQVTTVPEMHYGLGGLVDGSTHTAWNGNIVFNPSPMISSLIDWKAYLAQQYAAGTPVTVWYVLATEETGIVNEPLMRIGDYADSVDFSQAGVQIPTANGSTTLDVETAVKPSEVYIKYRGEAVATLSMLSAEVSSPEGTEEVNPEETEETENGSEDISLQHEFEAIE